MLAKASTGTLERILSIPLSPYAATPGTNFVMLICHFHPEHPGQMIEDIYGCVGYVIDHHAPGLVEFAIPLEPAQ